MLTAALGIALGLLALILPGIYLLVRWYLVSQAVVVERLRGVGALRRSAELVQDAWWRTFASSCWSTSSRRSPACSSLPSGRGADAPIASSSSLAGSIAAEILTMPFVAIVSTLLFYDLRARRQALPV